MNTSSKDGSTPEVPLIGSNEGYISLHLKQQIIFVPKCIHSYSRVAVPCVATFAVRCSLSLFPEGKKAEKGLARRAREGAHPCNALIAPLSLPPARSRRSIYRSSKGGKSNLLTNLILSLRKRS